MRDWKAKLANQRINRTANNKRRIRRRRRLTWAGEDSINLTPLLDVIFNLIFFFLLATTLKQTKAFLEVRLPYAQQATHIATPKRTIIITVSREDKVYVGAREVSFEELEIVLKKTPPSEIEGVILRGDARAHNEAIVKVLDTCVRAGHSGVALEVKTGEK